MSEESVVNARKEKVLAMRRSWRAARSTGDYSRRNLFFFFRILGTLGLTPASFARKAGCSVQTVNWWLVSDDCRLVTVAGCFARMGLSLSFELKPIGKPLPGGADVLPAEVSRGSMPLVEIDVSCAGFLPAHSGRKSGMLDSCVHLRSLASVVRSSGMSVAAFSQAAGISRQVLYRILRNDDIRISCLNALAERCQYKIVWKVTDECSVVGDGMFIVGNPAGDSCVFDKIKLYE